MVVEADLDRGPVSRMLLFPPARRDAELRAEMDAAREQWISEFAARRCPDCKRRLDLASFTALLFVLSNLCWILVEVVR